MPTKAFDAANAKAASGIFDEWNDKPDQVQNPSI